MKSKNKGFTLVEVIVAIAILGILLIGFLAVFTSSFIYIVNAGDNTNLSYQAQSSMENIHQTNESITGTDSLTIVFPSQSITVDGQLIQITLTEDGKTITIDSFIPNQ